MVVRFGATMATAACLLPMAAAAEPTQVSAGAFASQIAGLTSQVDDFESAPAGIAGSTHTFLNGTHSGEGFRLPAPGPGPGGPPQAFPVPPARALTKRWSTRGGGLAAGAGPVAAPRRRPRSPCSRRSSSARFVRAAQRRRVATLRENGRRHRNFTAAWHCVIFRREPRDTRRQNVIRPRPNSFDPPPRRHVGSL